MRPEDLELLEYMDGITKFSGEEAIERARQRLDETDYNLFSNNCESLINWALRDESVSYQVEDGVNAAVQVAVKVADKGADAVIVGLRSLVDGFTEKRE